MQQVRSPLISCFILALISHPSWAQEPLSEAARIAAETPFLRNLRGAGGDPQTSVAQPDTSARPSANITTSIQDLVGPYGDPGGVRSFLRTRASATA